MCSVFAPTSLPSSKTFLKDAAFIWMDAKCPIFGIPITILSDSILLPINGQLMANQNFGFGQQFVFFWQGSVVVTEIKDI